MTLYAKQDKMVSELYPSRGFQSTVSHRLHFGLGNVQQVDSIVITWPDGQQTQQYNLATNQLIQIEQKNGLAAVEEKHEVLKEFLLYFNIPTRKIILLSLIENVC